MDKDVAAANPALAAEEAYGRAVSAAEGIVADAERLGASALEPARRSVEELAALLTDDNQHLLAFANRSTPGDYLYGHMANVTALCVMLASHWGLDAAELRLIGLAAMLHDLGLKHWLGLGILDRRLSNDEVRQLRLHRAETVRLVEAAEGLDGAERRAVAEILTRSRVEGPVARKPAGVSDFVQLASQFLAVCDAYEAMSHSRAWRPGLKPYAAIKKVLQLPRDQFDPGVVKAFVSRLTLFPPGSYVRLEGGEVGRVIQVDPKVPTRPIVKFLVTPDGRGLRMPWYVDLRRQPLMHISGAVDETIVEVADLRLKALFAVERWWL